MYARVFKLRWGCGGLCSRCLEQEAQAEHEQQAAHEAGGVPPAPRPARPEPDETESSKEDDLNDGPRAMSPHGRVEAKAFPLATDLHCWIANATKVPKIEIVSSHQCEFDGHGCARCFGRNFLAQECAESMYTLTVSSRAQLSIHVEFKLLESVLAAVSSVLHNCAIEIKENVVLDLKPFVYIK